MLWGCALFWYAKEPTFQVHCQEQLSNDEEVDVKVVYLEEKYLSSYKEHCSDFICHSVVPSTMKQFAQ